jgi:hypothetical protein
MQRVVNLITNTNNNKKNFKRPKNLVPYKKEIIGKEK